MCFSPDKIPVLILICHSWSGDGDPQPLTPHRFPPPHCRIPAPWEILAAVRVPSTAPWFLRKPGVWLVCLLLPVGGASPMAERLRAGSGAVPGRPPSHPYSFLPLSSPVRPPSASKPTDCVWGEIVPDSQNGCQVSLKSWLNKGKQITKMEIFKLAFSGI